MSIAAARPLPQDGARPPQERYSPASHRTRQSGGLLFMRHVDERVRNVAKMSKDPLRGARLARAQAQMLAATADASSCVEFALAPCVTEPPIGDSLAPTVNGAGVQDKTPPEAAAAPMVTLTQSPRTATWTPRAARRRAPDRPKDADAGQLLDRSPPRVTLGPARPKCCDGSCLWTPRPRGQPRGDSRGTSKERVPRAFGAAFARSHEGRPSSPMAEGPHDLSCPAAG